jgi:hypothetical protein
MVSELLEKQKNGELAAHGIAAQLKKVCSPKPVSIVCPTAALGVTEQNLISNNSSAFCVYLL